VQQRKIANDQRRRKNGAGFGIFRIRADVTNMGIRQSDELFGIRGIGEDLLVTGHGGIEDHFANGETSSTDGSAFEYRTVSQGKKCGHGHWLAPVCCLHYCFYDGLMRITGRSAMALVPFG